MTTILYILFALLLFVFCIFGCIVCWGMFEDTEAGQMIIERMRKKHEEREEE